MLGNIKKKLLDTDNFIDNKYLDLYVNLIMQNEYNVAIKFKTQRHHILPRYYYKLHNIPLDDSNNNVVNLLYKDHVLAHYYLSLCTKNKLKYANQNAIYHVLGNSNYLKDPNYTEERNMLINLDKWQSIAEDMARTRSVLYKGKKYKPPTDEHKKRISELNTGNIYVRKFVNNNWIVKKAKTLDEFNNYLAEGWEKGNRPREDCHSHKAKSLRESIINGKKGKICITNGYQNKYINKMDLHIYLNQGWQKGCHKLKIRERVKIKKLGKILSIYKDELNSFIKKGWEEF